MIVSTELSKSGGSICERASRRCWSGTVRLDRPAALSAAQAAQRSVEILGLVYIALQRLVAKCPVRRRQSQSRRSRRDARVCYAREQSGGSRADSVRKQQENDFILDYLFYMLKHGRRRV
jgi:hypothetical protein